MELLEFIIQVIIISTSGVLFPGPLLISNIIHAKSYGYRSGLMIAFGHTIVELPLILLSSIILSFELFESINNIIGIIGGVSLIFFAIINIMSKYSSNIIIYKPFITGVMFSALNPFFISWWLTIGIKMINDAISLSTYGIFILFIAHIWLDYVWLIVTAYLASKGIKLLDNKYYRYLLLVLTGVLLYLGIKFIVTPFLYV